jgi:hypothetical protein
MNQLQKFCEASLKTFKNSFIFGLEARESEIQAILKVVESLMLSDFLCKKDLLKAKSDLKKIQKEYKTSIAFLKEKIKYFE